MKKNPTKPTVTLTVEGTDYELAFDFESIALAEEVTGRPLITGLRGKDIIAPTVSLVRAMLYATLHSYDASVTFDAAKAMVTRKTLGSIWNKVLEAWSLGIVDDDEDEAEDIADPTLGQS